MARNLAAAGILVVLAFAALPAGAGAATYSNPTPIGPADNAPLLPYPSTIAVGGEAGTIVNVAVTIHNATIGPIRDGDLLLVGPGASSMLLSDACSAGGIVPDWVNVTLTFDDNAAAPVPESCMVGQPPGTYKPSNYDNADNFPTVPGPYPVGLASFRGLSPNGAWQLYAVDDSVGDSTSIAGGWSLALTTTGPPPPSLTGQRAAALKKCKKKKSKKKRKKCRRRALKLPV